MEFTCLVLFLLMYCFRPQEWVGILNSFHPIQLLSVFALYAIFTRDKKFGISDILKTPHDWVILGYLAWTVYGSPTPWETFKVLEPLILFYIVAVQALASVGKIKIFLGWWAFSLLLISGLAVASQYGFDPFGSYDLTNGIEKGRLALNLSIYNNPNGLGHTVVPVIPMIYFLFFWKKSVGKVSLVLLLVPLYCIFLTESKGAFLCAFATILTTLTFGRPKMVQITILALAGVFGVGALYTLPRMNELQKTKSNEAIAGRTAAFKFGYEMMQTRTFGVGLANFIPEFTAHGPLERYPVKKMTSYRANGETHSKMVRIWRFRHYTKASHSSFNQNGAELGYGGFILFIGTLYSCLRTLITMTKGDVEEERVRRALFAVVISYIVSGWMVDFGFRATFFLFVAATGAFHRLVRSNTPELVPEEQVPAKDALWKRKLLPQSSEVALDSNEVIAAIPDEKLDGVKPSIHSNEADPKGTIQWKRIGLVDIACTFLLGWAAIRFWLYSIENF